MTRITITLAALAAFAAAAPAAAQTYGRYDGYAAGNVDTEGLRAEIDAGVSRGDISSQEAWSLRSQLRGLVNLERQYAADGLSWRERNDLQQRAQGLRNEIAQAGGYASSDGRYDNRYNGGRYNDGRYNDGRSGTYGTNYNGYGNGYGRQGTYDNRAYGNGAYSNGTYPGTTYPNGTYRNGTYPNAAYPNSAYPSGQYSQSDRTYRDDSSDNRDDGYADEQGYSLRVGERAPDGLYAVPDAYRARYRDSGSVYYRYGGGNVYQIDVRNGTVLRVIPIER